MNIPLTLTGKSDVILITKNMHTKEIINHGTIKAFIQLENGLMFNIENIKKIVLKHYEVIEINYCWGMNALELLIIKDGEV